MDNAPGEMPFLDHLEELRSRLIYALIAIVVCVGIGIWAVLNLDLLVLLKEPIAPYLPDGRLTILGVTDQFMIVLKLGFIIGMVLASPVLMYQLWAFLSPALYERERKLMLPALIVGLLLFSVGVWAAWTWVLPFTIDVALTFQGDAFNPMITYEKYFGFVVQVLLAMGLMFELPLVMILLAMIGVMTAKQYSSWRRFAVVLAFIAGALLSPGADVISMVLFTVPILLLYEIGVAGAALVGRRKRRAAARNIGAAHHRVPASGPRPRARRTRCARPACSTAATPSRSSAHRRRACGRSIRRPPSAWGCRPAPRRIFPSPDSVMQSLLDRRGFAVTRFLGDSATLFATDQRIVLGGRAATERDDAKLEAEQIVYDDGQCEMVAQRRAEDVRGRPDSRGSDDAIRYLRRARRDR